jgi:hypothetical protein
MPIYLETLRKCPMHVAAAQAAGISTRQAWEWRKKRPEFGAACDEACKIGAHVIEVEGYRRAVHGWEKPIYGRDKDGNPVLVGHERLYDTRLMEMMLRAHMPEKYSPKIQQEISGPGGSPFAPSVIAPTVIFQIPDNGRSSPQPINIDAQIKALTAPPQPQQGPELPQPELEPAQPEQLPQQQDPIDQRNAEAMARIRAEGRENEKHGGQSYDFRGRLNTNTR